MQTPTLLHLAVVLAAVGASLAVAEEQQTTSARLRFVPEGGAWKGESEFKGASWTHLGPGLKADSLFLQARVGVGDKFPVQDKAGATLFEIKLVEGNDDRVAVEVQTKSGNQKVDLPRDRSVEVNVSGTKYELLYPSIRVGASAKETPSTNKATLIVTRRLN
jgi:hypothetical protein